MFSNAIMNVVMAAAMMSVQGSPTAAEPVKSVLQRYVDDYRRDPFIQDITFGVDIDGQAWTIVAKPSEGGNPASVQLSEGPPTVPALMWKMSRETLDKIATGQMSAMTASAKARSSEVAPLEIAMVNGFAPDKIWGQNVFRPLIFHFWTMGQPEIARFGFDKSRLVHGGRAIPGVYAPGIRTSWYGILKGDHINKDPRSQKDPWTSVFFITKGGSAKARIGDKVIDLEDNSMIHVPPQTVHKFWNEGDVPAEMIMVTFGKDS